MKPFLFAVVLFVAFTNHCLALINPDAPDYVGELEKKIAPLEKHINEKAITTLDYIEGYAKLEVVLDQEMNRVYKLLLSRLNAKEKKALKSSQIRWLKFRDAEFNWIDENWTRDNFGSSYAISRGCYRTTIIKERVLHLMNYLMNY